MEEKKPLAQTADKIFNIEKIDHATFVGAEKKREPVCLLTEPPFNPQFFIGRDADLAAIKKDFGENKQLLILVNGEGGMGKTTLAAKYWTENLGSYTHAAWLFADSGVANALLRLADKLNLLPFDPQDDEAAQIRKVSEKINQLPAPCLLVFDNANDGEDLEKRYATLRKLLNCHILITSRALECYDAPVHFVRALDEKTATQLFRKYYDKYPDAEAPLLADLLQAVGFNTLVMELLAKNLAAFNEFRPAYSLQNLLDDLKAKGLFAIKTKTVQVAYQSEALRKEKPENILAAMYDLSGLQEAEKSLLNNFAVLPAENIPYDQLIELLQPDDINDFDQLIELLQPDDINAFDENLSALRKKGWIEYSEAGLKISPVVQEIVKLKNKECLLKDCEILIRTLIDKLDGEVLYLDQDARIFLRYAETVVFAFQDPDYNVGVLCQNIGNCHLARVALDEALTFYEEWNRLEKERYAGNPDNVSFKNGLAISHSKLGDIHSALGALDKALAFYEEGKQLGKELYSDYPGNVSFKNGLAISYSKLGETHSALGALDNALAFYEEQNRLGKELYSAYPDNVKFKKGLAISYERLGNTHSALGDLNQALAFYEEYNRLKKELYADCCHEMGFEDGLAISYLKLGNTHSALGALDKALDFYEEYNRLKKELYSAYPGDLWSKKSLAISCQFLGNTHLALGALDKAKAFYEEQNRFSKELYSLYPQNMDFKNGLAISYSKLGETYFALGDLGKALVFYKDGIQIFKDLYFAYPGNVSFKINLAVSYQNSGNTHSALGDLDKALAFYEEFNRLEKELYAAYPDNVDFKNGLAISYSKLGKFYLIKKNDKTKAIFNLQQCEKLWSELANDFPSYADFQNNLEWVKTALSEI